MPALGKYLLESKHVLLRLAGEAVLHEYCDVVPKTPDLGYTLAEYHEQIFDWALNEKKAPEEYKWLRKIEIDTGWELSNYVLKHTHYDECNNGYFFRRS